MFNYEMEDIVKKITYKPGWTIDFHIDHHRGSSPYVQIAVDERSDASLDSQKRDGTRTPWKSGKRYLSQFMTRQEIVGTIFDLIKAAELHEAHEWFRYKNASIYNPHLDPDVLANVARNSSSFLIRPDSMIKA